MKLAMPLVLACALVAPVAVNGVGYGAERMNAKAEEAVSSTAAVKYESDYESEEALVEATRELNIRMATEGSVLLKNKNGALPLRSYERNVTVFHSFFSTHDGNGAHGEYSEDYMFISGEGSGRILKEGYGDIVKTDIKGLYEGFKENGINYNHEKSLRRQYERAGSKHKRDK